MITPQNNSDIDQNEFISHGKEPEVTSLGLKGQCV